MRSKKNKHKLWPSAGENYPLILVIGCFFLSGFAGLLYQIAWLRQFSIVFGTSELAVATVLAAYMGGLALGAVIIDRFVNVVSRPVLVYGILEAGIAVSALCVPIMLWITGQIFTALLGGQSAPPNADSVGQVGFYLAASFIILSIPTGFMGATLPLLTRYAVHTDKQVGPRIALLYGVNAFGALVGAVITGFFLLGALGLLGTVGVGVAANFLVFLLAMRLSASLPSLHRPNDSEASKTGSKTLFTQMARLWQSNSASILSKVKATFQQQVAWILPLMLLSGAIAFLYEVLWTRMLNHVLGGSIYAFTTMLATFLAGIAIGSAVAGRFALHRERAVRIFTITQLAIAVASALIYALLDLLVPEDRSLGSSVIFAISVMLPATLFIGATFPLAVRILAENERTAANAAALVYAWNTVGAIIGAIGTGFWLIPAIGFSGAIKLAVVVNMVIGLGAAMLIGSRKKAQVLIPIAGIMVTVLAYHPVRPITLINSAGFKSAQIDNANEEFFEVGRSSTVQIVNHGGGFDLRTNGLPEASIIAAGAPPFKHLQKWLTALPVLAKPDASNMLVVGFGGGVALEGVSPSVDAIDVIEIEKEVINANRAISNRRADDPLADPRLNIIINDARNALRLTKRRYDIIVSQPSHPWTAGASHLFTQEFLELARQQLNNSGVYLQWMNANFVDEPLLRSLTATMLAVFDHVRVYHAESGVLFFLGSREPIAIEQNYEETTRLIAEQSQHYAKLGINSVEDLIVALAMDEAGARLFADGAAVITDNFNKMATDSRFRGDGISVSGAIEAMAAYDPLLNIDSWIYRDQGSLLSFEYVALRLLQDGLALRANKLANILADRSSALLINGMGLGYQGKSEDALAYIKAAIDEDFNNLQAKYALVQNQRVPLLRGAADQETMAVAKSLEGSAAAVLAGWHYAATRNWPALAALDDILAQSKPTDLWYTQAVQLRAEWRTKVSVEHSGTKFALEALQMLDGALLLKKDLDLYILRAGTGVLVDDPRVFVETAWHVRFLIEGSLERAQRGELEISSAQEQLMADRLEGILQEMQGEFVWPVADRAATIRKDIEVTLTRLRNKRT